MTWFRILLKTDVVIKGVEHHQQPLHLTTELKEKLKQLILLTHYPHKIFLNLLCFESHSVLQIRCGFIQLFLCVSDAVSVLKAALRFTA